MSSRTRYAIAFFQTPKSISATTATTPPLFLLAEAKKAALYVARFNPDNTGTWIALNLETPTNPIAPSVISSAALSHHLRGLTENQ
ncbi:hypothetical protein [Brasilonema bromeliae]|uniref:Uncharacterized protein n=1 Tax=Brasilonema bromeliae SPC951 TaxID=385972 RepID=A0ABX1PC35_9CYAN|nr:hypothetical protein [Brasilonema bromeliae]NMG21136.1 hypothetical protein [Brasilonema bromeliae SPC951]